ncbi:MAG: DUF3489 domain-containing protein [Bryobacterales bacterium]|nr:DUF3489 domain-containing protein [Bryobacterales bacterium]
MAIYTIDDNNIITARSEAPTNGTPGIGFDSQKDLAKATAEWPVSRLADTWNNLPIGGLKPVKKFMDRKTAVARIWTAIQNLTPVPAPDAATGAKPVAKARKRPQANGGAPGAREGSKKAIILTMLRHPEGATLTQIMEATHWQPHTVRGFISGAIGKQLGLGVESTRTEKGERRYRIPA